MWLRRGSLSVLAAAAVAAALAALAAIAVASANETTLISRTDGAAGAKANDDSRSSPVSADGRFVAFTSSATNLDPADNDLEQDVYLRDTVINETILVSRADGLAGAKGNDGSSSPSISADGRFVAFTSSATNLDPADNDTSRDVYLRDTETNETILVSRADGANGVKGDESSGSPSLSADGRHVAFISDSTNLDPADTDTESGVFVRDTQTNETTLVSRADGAVGANANGSSGSPAISPDGRFIGFDSRATNLDPADTDTTQHVYLRDTQAHLTSLVSRADGAGGAVGSRIADTGSVSAGGRFVAFTTEATNLDPADTDTSEDIYLRDTQADDSILVSRADGAAGVKANDYATSAAKVSSTGRFVAFYSAATNLDPADTDGISDVFVRDTQANETTLVSRADGAAGAKGNASSSRPEISLDGRFVAFTSSATNLDPADTDLERDVYLRQLTADTKVEGRASAKKKQKQKGKKIVVKVKVKAREDLRAQAKGKVKVKKKNYKLKPQTKGVSEGKKKTLKLKPKKRKDAKKIAKALKKGKKATAKLKVKLTDGAGNTKTEKLKVKLKR